MSEQPTTNDFPIGCQVRTRDGGIGHVRRVSTTLKASVLVEFPNGASRAYRPDELARRRGGPASPFGPLGGPF